MRPAPKDRRIKMPIDAFIRVARAVGIAISLPLLSLGSFRANAAELIPFKVGQAAPANTFLAIWMAQAAGFDEAQGLKFEIVAMVGGSESGPELKAGRIHLMHIGMSPLLRATTPAPPHLTSTPPLP